MRIWHGASQKVAAGALQTGLKPRGNSTSNWPTMPSRDDCVYLTSAFGPYYSSIFGDGSAEITICLVEVDTDCLDQSCFLPDEDFLFQLVDDSSVDALKKLLLDEETLEFLEDEPVSPEWSKDVLEDYQYLWTESISRMGNCAYQGEIPPEAISRVIYWKPPRKSVLASMALLDPTATLLNFLVVGEKYLAITKWLSGEEVEPTKALCVQNGFPADVFLQQAKEIPEMKEVADSVERALEKLQVEMSCRDNVTIVENPIYNLD